MPRKRWATDPQLELVRSFLPAFTRVSNDTKKAMKRFWPKLEEAWFAKYPLKAELVASGILPAIVLEEGYEIPKNSKEEEIYKKRLEKREEQLKTLIRYEHRQLGMKSGVVVDSKRSAMSTAAKGFVKPQRRCPQPQEMYYRLFAAEIDAMFDQEKGSYVDSPGGERYTSEEVDVNGVEAEDGDDVKEGKRGARSRGWNLRLCRRIFTREWENASQERKTMVLEEIEKEKVAMAMEADLEETGKALARPTEYRLGSMQRIHAFWGSNAQLCWENAAMMSVQIGVAPDPADGDKLMTMSISCGLDQNGKVFQDVFPNFQEVFVKPILTWAKNNVFTPAAWEKAKAEAAKARDAKAAQKMKKEGEDEDDDEDEDEDDDENENEGKDEEDGPEEDFKGLDDGGKGRSLADPMLLDLNESSRTPSPDLDDGHAFDLIHGISHSGDATGDEPVVSGVAGTGAKSASEDDIDLHDSLTPPTKAAAAANTIFAGMPPTLPSAGAFSTILDALQSAPGQTTQNNMAGYPGFMSPMDQAQVQQLRALSHESWSSTMNQPHDPNTGPNEPMEIGLQRALEPTPFFTPTTTQGPNLLLGFPPIPPGTFTPHFSQELLDPALLTQPASAIPSLQQLIDLGKARNNVDSLGASSTKAASTMLDIVAAASKTTPTARPPVPPHISVSVTTPTAASSTGAPLAPFTSALTAHPLPSSTAAVVTAPTAASPAGAPPAPSPLVAGASTITATVTASAAPAPSVSTPSFQTNVPQPQRKTKDTTKPATTTKKGAKKKAAKAQKDEVEQPKDASADEPITAKKRKAAKDPAEKPTKAAKTMTESSVYEETPQEEGRSKRARQPAKRFDGGVYVEVTTAAKGSRPAPRKTSGKTKK